MKPVERAKCSVAPPKLDQMNLPNLATPRRPLAALYPSKHAFVAGAVGALLLASVPAHANGTKFGAWREYHLDMTSKEFSAVHAASCGAPPPFNPAQVQVAEAEKAQVIVHPPVTLPDMTICENTVSIREAGGFDYRVQGTFSGDRLQVLTIQIVAGSSINNDARRRQDLVKSVISAAAQRYGAPDLMQTEVNGPTVADWRFDDGASLKIAQTDSKIFPGVIVIQSAKANHLSDFQ